MNRHPLIDFYYFNGTDNCGRTLNFILQQNDEWLESTHDYIQWLFPLRERSGANPDAPLIDTKLSMAFGCYEMGSMHMLKAFDRMLAFFGLERDGEHIGKSAKWNDRKEYWFLHPTHNDLRITRIISSMTTLGLSSYAQALLKALLLLSVDPECGFSREAIEYWQSANLKSSPHIGIQPIVNNPKQIEAILHNVEHGYEAAVLPAIRKLVAFEEMYRREVMAVEEYFSKHDALPTSQPHTMGSIQ